MHMHHLPFFSVCIYIYISWCLNLETELHIRQFKMSITPSVENVTHNFHTGLFDEMQHFIQNVAHITKETDYNL